MKREEKREGEVQLGKRERAWEERHWPVGERKQFLKFFFFEEENNFLINDPNKQIIIIIFFYSMLQ